MAQTPYQQLEQEFRRLHAFRGAASLLRWDAAVMMPRGSADVRGEQLAALDSECHTLLTSPKVSRLIERAQASASQLEDWQLANLREMRRERDHAIATPLSLVTRLARATSLAEVRWLEAKQENNPSWRNTTSCFHSFTRIVCGTSRGNSAVSCANSWK